MPPKEVRTTGDKSSQRRKAKPAQQPQGRRHQEPSNLNSVFRPPGIAPGHDSSASSTRAKPAFSAQPVVRDTSGTPSPVITSGTSPQTVSDLIEQPRGDQKSTVPVSPVLPSSTGTSFEATIPAVSSVGDTVPILASSQPGPVSASTFTSFEEETIKSVPLQGGSGASDSLIEAQSKAGEDSKIPEDEPKEEYASTPEIFNISEAPQVKTGDMSHLQSISALQTNCYLTGLAETIYKYEIVCDPLSALTRKEKRWIEKAFLDELHITPKMGSVAFIDGHTFLTPTVYQGLEKHMFEGTINRRLEKPDDSFRPIYLGRDGAARDTIRAWSSLTKGGCFSNELLHEHIPYQNGGTKIGSQLIKVRAHVEVELLDSEALLVLLNKSSIPPGLLHHAGAPLSCLPADKNTQRTSEPTSAIGTSLAVHGSKVFDFSLPGDPLRHGLESRSGALYGLQTTDKGLLRTILPCYRVFYSPVKVSDFLEEHLPWFVFTSPKAVEVLRTLLRGLKVQIKRSQGQARIATISGIAKTNPAETHFALSTVHSDRVTNVADYFTKGKSSH